MGGIALKREQITEEERAARGAERRAAYRAAHREELAAKQRAYNAAHPGRYAKNREKFAAAKRERYAANRDRCRAAARGYYAAHPEKENAKRIARRQASTAESRRAIHLRWTYRLTLSDYDAILASQGGRCVNQGCRAENSGSGRFHVDHDHSCCPGKKSCGKCIRGLLCSSCNVALGYLGDGRANDRILGLYEYASKVRP